MIQYIVTNFGCGNGPFLRAVDLALAVRDRMVAAGSTDEIRVLVPHVYGDRMPQLLQENHADRITANPHLFVLDEGLGRLLEQLIYDGRDFRFTLDRLATAYPEIQTAVTHRLSERFDARAISGEPVTVSPDQLRCSVSRNPNVRMGTLPSFYTSIGYLERILKQTAEEPLAERYDASLLRRAAEHARRAEDGQMIYFQPEPSAFSWATDATPFREGEIRTPPLFHPPQRIQDRDLKPGVYVLVSGIPELGRLYRDVTAQGWNVYVNQQIDEIPGAIRIEPKYVAHPAIQAVYARAAWNTIWLANLSKKPLICPAFMTDDFPEIAFNNRTVEQLQLGAIVHQGVSATDAIEQARALQPSIDAYYDALRRRYGTLDGIDMAASQIAKAVIA